MLIRNIIFDLGEVIIPLSFERMVNKFAALGLPHFDEFYRQRKSDLFDPFELGELSSAQFRLALRSYFHVSERKVSDQQLDEAWNAWLGEIPEERLSCIRSLKKQGQYRMFLFSNTNPIHLHEIYRRHGKNVFNGCFEEEFYSFQFRQKKPQPLAFVSIQKKRGLRAEETIHVDDSLEHLVGARAAGMQVLHVATGKAEKNAEFTSVESLIEAVRFIEAHNHPRLEVRKESSVRYGSLAIAEAEQPKKSLFSCCFPFFKCCAKVAKPPVKEEEYQYLSSDDLSVSL